MDELLSKVKANLILEHTADDALLKSYITAAVSYAESYQHIPPKAEQVGRFTEYSEVCPPLTAVPTFPIDTDRSEDFILGMSEALAVLNLPGFHNIGKAVHFPETHDHTFQSRSSRNSRLTVFHTCCAAPVLSAKKPPVLPSRLS